MKVFLNIFIFSLIFCFPGIAVSGNVQLEHNYDRPGGELVTHYKNINSPGQCMDLCKNNSSCVAFTWVRPGVQGPGGFCWLKASLSRKVANNCCISGVVRNVRQDRCKWFQFGSTYQCKCESAKTRKWYLTNPSACTQPKPSPRYIETPCPPGTYRDLGVFGQGSGKCIPR